ncbi:hypothetical protein HK103_004482 [Boothiomyces macroporosus]|uniref:Succinylglutamate desuccinylase/Aspartoacylase catalytic domain-containing protein n=1 Tax=Boothiomyces macroporosus TaxID=261099 RepID=A0AAD5UGG6_9FUNG|nr:hypothetical protein HK103_004482 [Boothiomyces macroporosus]
MEKLTLPANVTSGQRKGTEKELLKSPSVFSDASSCGTNVQIIKPSQTHKRPWKNGLGQTTEIAISPANADFHTDDFVWRFSTYEVHDSCNFSIFPNHDITLVLLPDAHQKSTFSRAQIRHLDFESPVDLHVNQPYTYNGEWNTSCKISVSVETICSNSLLSDDSSAENLPYTSDPIDITEIPNEMSKLELEEITDTGTPVTKIGPSTSTMSMGNITILHVIKGSIKVNVEGNSKSFVLEKGVTLICERDDSSFPTDVTMTPLLKPAGIGEYEYVVKGGLGISNAQESEETGDAVVILIHIYLLPSPLLPAESAIMSPPIINSYPSTASLSQGQTGPRTSKTRKGSIIVFDDQPMWNVPSELIRRESIAAELGSTGKNANLTTKYWESAHHYIPPVFSDRYSNESDVPPPIVRDDLNIEDFPAGTISTAWINMVKQGLSEWIRVPVIVARGTESGPVVGITAVVHGNELNGVPCIHRVITDIDVSKLIGTVVAVPCVNVPGYLRFTREFSDGKDLNRSFPGHSNGTASQVYNYHLFTKIIKKFNYLIDLHTASFGRVNSYYVRADMNDAVSSVLAKLQQPQVILHNSGQDGTLRSAASAIGIRAITVEIGNPQLFQNQYVQWSYKGVMRILSYLNMFTSDLSLLVGGSPLTIVCSRGFWMYTKTGGVLEVYPSVNTIVKKGDLIARIKNIFGNIIEEIYSTHTGVTIGRSSNPVAMAGDRILHMGIIKKENEALAAEAKENY